MRVLIMTVPDRFLSFLKIWPPRAAMNHTHGTDVEMGSTARLEQKSWGYLHVNGPTPPGLWQRFRWGKVPR